MLAVAWLLPKLSPVRLERERERESEREGGREGGKQEEEFRRSAPDLKKLIGVAAAVDAAEC